MVCLQVFWSVGEEQMFGEELNTRGTPECGHRTTDYDRLRNYAGISCDQNQVRLKDYSDDYSDVTGDVTI